MRPHTLPFSPRLALRQLGRHQSALEHAQQALILLQEELARVVGPMAEEAGESPKADRVAVLAIAYHNVGVEYEFLKKYDQSLQSYRKGVEVSERFLGTEHAITTTLRNSTVAARRAIMARDPHVRLQKLSTSSGAGAGGRKSHGRAMASKGSMISPRPTE